MKRFSILAIIISILLTGCIRPNQKASINDLHVGGLNGYNLLLDGSKDCTTTFTLTANYDWQIIDYKGFVCHPSAGSKTEGDEVVTIEATTLQANNTADTVRLSDLNFKLLSTRFVGISAYQLPQIRLSKGDKIYINALKGSLATIKFVSSCNDIELVTEGDITASLGEKNSRNEYTITIETTQDNNSTESQVIGSIGFNADGVRQESKIEVIQNSAIVLDRSVVLLPSKARGENIFTVESTFDVEASSDSELFKVIKVNKNTFAVTANADNTTNTQLHLGYIDIVLTDIPECKVALNVYQRKAKAPQTIIVHFIGTALQHYFNHNVTKIVEALNKDIQGDAQVVVITTDSTNDATLYELRYDTFTGKAVKEKVKELSLPTPYNSDLFESILHEALNFAPAEKYALVIGSHGLGWIPKVPSSGYSRALQRLGISTTELWQRNKNAEMTRHLGDRSPAQYNVSEIAEAIENNNIRFEYILFDACFMGNIESAYDLRNSTKYIIGSPCEVMGYGFPYARIIPYMLTDNGAGYNLDKICSEYVDYYKADAATPSACVAVTATAELDALATAMKAVNESDIKESFSLSNVQYYEGQNPHSFYDLGDMVEQSCANDAVATAFKTQLDKTVTSRYHTKQFYSAYGSNNKYYHDIIYYSGITTSAMVDHYSADWQQTAWYKATH